MLTREIVDYSCPYCGKLLCRIRVSNGARSEDSAPLSDDDEHGKYSICLNDACKRKIRMEHLMQGVWTPAREH